MVSQEDIIKLTNAVYQVTGAFPENEPLQEQIRRKANDILAGLVGANPKILDKKRCYRQSLWRLYRCPLVKRGRTCRWSSSGFNEYSR